MVPNLPKKWTMVIDADHLGLPLQLSKITFKEEISNFLIEEKKLDKKKIFIF